MGQKSVNALILDLPEVVHHAHAVFEAVTGVQLLQAFTGHLLALVTEVGWGVLDRLAVLDDASLTGRWFVLIIFPASRASVLGTLVCHA
jgi:hypothetical protein